MKDVTNPDYWRDRMYGAFASGERHRLMFNGSLDQFNEIEERQKKALRAISHRQSILDVGCGYGRLPDLLRVQGWKGRYVGYDVSPDLIEVARKWWSNPEFYEFHVADLAIAPPTPSFRADWAVALWLKTMLINNMMIEKWERIEAWMRLHAKNVLVVD